MPRNQWNYVFLEASSHFCPIQRLTLNFSCQFVMSDSSKLESWVPIIGRTLESDPAAATLEGLLRNISRTLASHLAPAVRICTYILSKWVEMQPFLFHNCWNSWFHAEIPVSSLSPILPPFRASLAELD